MNPRSNIEERSLANTILTFTHARDMHSVFVSAALDFIGSPNEIVVLDTILSDGGVGLHQNGTDATISIRDQNIVMSVDQVAAFWNRRRPLHLIQKPETFAPDRPYLESCAVTLSRSMSLLGETGFAVNPATGILHGGDKFAQLRAAAKAGLCIPETVVTNDADTVHAFLRKHGTICVKSIRTINWLKEQKSYSAFTTLVADAASLPRESIELTPTIYQERIEKEFELRLTVFGNYYCATRIDSQSNPETSLDWRRDLAYLRQLTDFTIPDELFTKVKAVMRAVGIRFGTFDLAYNRHQGWVFFEVNESGQFLWQESFCDDSLILEPFARFLASGDDNFTFDKRQRSSELGMKALQREHATLRQYTKMMAYPPVPIGTFYLIDEGKGDGVEPEMADLLESAPAA